MASTHLPRVVTTAEAQGRGFTPARVRTEVQHGRWTRLAAGVFLTRPELPSRADWVQAGLAVAGPRSVVSGWDASAIYGVAPTQPPTPSVLVLTRGGKNRVVGQVRIRPTERLIDHPRVVRVEPELTWIPLAPAARAVADTSLDQRSLAAVRAMVTSAVQRELCTAEQLAAEVDAGPRNGSRLLRRVLADLAEGAWSVAEAEAIEALRQHRGIPPFEVNAPIHDPVSGRVVAVADVLWSRIRLILEIDSREFHFAEADWKRTMARHNLLARLGYCVLHYPPSAVRGRPREWAAEVAAQIRSRAASLAVPTGLAVRTS